MLFESGNTLSIGGPVCLLLSYIWAATILYAVMVQSVQEVHSKLLDNSGRNDQFFAYPRCHFHPRRSGSLSCSGSSFFLSYLIIGICIRYCVLAGICSGLPKQSPCCNTICTILDKFYSPTCPAYNLPRRSNCVQFVECTTLR